MESELIVKLITTLSIVGSGLFLALKIVDEIFKDRKNKFVKNIQELVNEAIELRFKGFDDKLSVIGSDIKEINKHREDDRKEFNRNLIEVFKEFK